MKNFTQKLKSILKNKYTYISLLIIILIISQIILVVLLYKKDKNKTEDTQETTTQETQGQAKTDEDKKENGMFLFPPKQNLSDIDLDNQPKQSKGTEENLVIDSDILSNMNPHINSNILSTPDSDQTIYAKYLGLGNDVDQVFPPNAFIFVNNSLDGNNEILVHYYIIPGDKLDKNQLTEKIYEIKYNTKDLEAPIIDNNYIFHNLNAVIDYSSTNYEYMVTGVYKGNASENIDKKYTGYVDLQAYYGSELFHFLISKIRISNIPLTLDKAYTFLSTDYSDDGNNIFILDGSLNYLQND